MKYTTRIVLGFLSVLMIVSFQNCGQSGVINLASQPDLAKIDMPQSEHAEEHLDNRSDDQLDDQSDNQSSINNPVQNPVKVDDPVSQPNDVSHGSIRHDDGKDKEENKEIDISKDEPDYDVDENDGTIISGHQISCARLNKLAMASSQFVKSSNQNSKANSMGALKIVNQDDVSISNHKGLLFLLDINHILGLKNIKSMILLASAESIGEIENVRALSLMSADNISNISNFRGLLCLDTINVSSISNFRGVLEVSGNIKKISNFRGILKVKGNIGVLENFRGILKVDGDISSQSNVKVKID